MNRFRNQIAEPDPFTAFCNAAAFGCVLHRLRVAQPELSFAAPAASIADPQPLAFCRSPSCALKEELCLLEPTL